MIGNFLEEKLEKVGLDQIFEIKKIFEIKESLNDQCMAVNCAFRYMEEKQCEKQLRENIPFHSNLQMTRNAAERIQRFLSDFSCCQGEPGRAQRLPKYSSI